MFLLNFALLLGDRAYATVLRLSSSGWLAVRNVLWLNGAS